MSGIAGIYNLDGRPVDGSLLRRMTDAMAHRGPDGTGHWVRGPVALGQRMLHTTPESLLEQQPLTDESGTLCLTLDGRVDNRAELRAALEAKGARVRDTTDAELILRAYECWGEECPQKIIGDFAFAIWDGRNQQLFCARDALGVRPFYYYTGDRLVAFASDPAAIFALPEVDTRLNLDALADYLVNNLADSEPTEFEQLYRLRPAHSLSVQGSSIRKRQYWDVDPNRVLEWKNPERYEEAFQEVFNTAVRACLRSLGSPGVVVSGGLDSSSILCWMEDLKARGETGAEIKGYSAVFDRQAYDESHYVRSIQERWGTPIHFCRPEPPTPLWGLAEARRGNTQPMSTPMAYLVQSLLDSAASDGRRVVLAGVGGDDFMDAPTNLAAALFTSGRVGAAWDYTVALARFHSVSVRRAVLLCLVQPLLSQLLPSGIKNAYRSVRPGVSCSWLRHPYLGRVLERKRSLPWHLRGRKFTNAGRRSAYNIIHSGYRIRALENWDRLAAVAGAGVEVRHPFCDRRLVEFASAVPDTEMVRGGEPKGLLRAALGSRLPDLVRHRRGKADFATLMNQRLIFDDADAIMSLLAGSRLEEIGLVDGKRARQHYDTYRKCYAQRLAAKQAVDSVWQLPSLEGWLQEEYKFNANRSDRCGLKGERRTGRVHLGQAAISNT